MQLNETLVQKWAKILDTPDAPAIRADRKAVVAHMLEEQSKAPLFEDAPTNNSVSTPGIDRYDPVLISLVRRSMPNLMAFDLAGVQPMSGPTGLIFALRSRYGGGSDRFAATEALFNEADTDFSGTGTHAGSNPVSGTYTTGRGMTTAAGEALGTSGGGTFNEMSFTIEKATVTANTRALKAEYSTELATDLQNVHGLSADSELARILEQELLAEMNREVVRTIYQVARVGAQTTASAGTFDLDIDANGRWSVERFKGMLFQIERDANAIAQETRRGKGNIIIASADVAAALAMSGQLDYAPALSTGLEVDDTGNTFAGVLNKRYKVFIDPYSANIGAASQFFVVGYKGSSSYDAGLFYCPYVPLQMVRTMDPNSFQPKMGFKTRYGLIANPFVRKVDGTADNESFTAGRNQYFRKVTVTNLM